LILVDTSALYAAANARQPEHARVRAALESQPGPLLISPFVLAEIDYLIEDRAGVDAEIAFLKEVALGTYRLMPFGGDDVGAARFIIESYRDLGLGLADASIVVLAGKLGTNRVLTLDERHFRAVRTVDGKPFEILPADLG
jgi:predicted nucleic acid-binding protein